MALSNKLETKLGFCLNDFWISAGQCLLSFGANKSVIYRNGMLLHKKRKWNSHIVFIIIQLEFF